ncbi:MAG: hypothetical protein P4L81_07875 [Candidatus Pacebacteria bacterium]|nr:hypothetical protein [Candidatus Paceibacterota bacterium]
MPLFPDQNRRALAFLADQWFIEPVAGASPSELPDRIFKAATSGKWRRSALDPVSYEDTLRKIATAHAERKRLEFTLPFGGYKGRAVASCPHINWAEVFALNFLRRYALFVSREYTGGVLITLSYASSIMDLVNNMPLSRQTTYVSELSRLCVLFSDHDIKFQLYDVASAFPTAEDFRTAVRENFERVKHTWTAMDGYLLEKRLNSARRNLIIDGVEDLSNVSGDAFDEKVRDSAMFCEALDSLTERRRFNKYSHRVQLVNVRGPSPAIHLASCDTSANHFGVGTGAVEIRRDGCLQSILTTEAIRREIVNGSLSYFDVDDNVSHGFVGLRSGLIVSRDT